LIGVLKNVGELAEFAALLLPSRTGACPELVERKVG
jgi:hypothetical protein